jgi:hypothetical protein
MLKLNARNIFLPILSIVIASISCISTPGETAPWVAADEELQDLNKKTCGATLYLDVTSKITRQETNQYGTRLCEYKLKITNTHQDGSVRFYIYQHDQDGYAHTEKYHWMGNMLIEPGKEGEWSGNVYLYTDKDADGPVMSVPEKIAGVFDSEDCALEKKDAKFFEQVSIPIDPVCPME